MKTRRLWMRRAALTAALVCTTILGAATSYADVTVTETRLSGGRYRLQAVTTGAPCDAWEWIQLAGEPAILNPDDAPTTEVEVGVGLYVFQATCIRGEGEEQTRQSIPITIDTRPSGANDIPAAEMWAVPYEGPLCLHCPDWTAPLEESVLDLYLEGLIRTDLDFPAFVEIAEELALDPTPTPMMPNDVDLSFGGIDTYASTPNGANLGAGLTLTGFAEDGFERITAGALNIDEGELVIGAFLLEVFEDDPSPQPS